MTAAKQHTATLTLRGMDRETGKVVFTKPLNIFVGGIPLTRDQAAGWLQDPPDPALRYEVEILGNLEEDWA